MPVRRFLVMLAFVLGIAPGTAHAAIAARADDPCAVGERYFPATRLCVSPRFAAYWDGNGGLAQQGNPIGKAVDEVNPGDGKTYRVQYFERARFEAHPENQAPHDVELGRLGAEQQAARYPTGTPPRPGPCPIGEQAFAPTQRCVGARFAAYWAEHGGLAQQGYPLGDELIEISPLDNQPYRVQYFERARFEHHPEHQAPYDVLLGLLGSEQHTAKYGGGRPGPSPSGSPAPGNPIIFRDGFAEPQSGWPTGRAPGGEGELSYANGGYRIGIAAARYGLLPTNAAVGSLGDVRIEVAVAKVDGPNDTPFGIQCRAKNSDNLYAALHDGEGHAAIYKIQGGKSTTLASTGKGASPAFKTGDATNHLRFDCLGGALTFYANGQKVAEAQDATFATGRIGFAGFTRDRGGLDIVFRTLVVYGVGGNQSVPSPVPAPTSRTVSGDGAGPLGSWR